MVFKYTNYIFVKFIIIILFVALLVSACSKNANETDNYNSYSIIFNNIANLKISDNVVFDGNNIGYVTEIKLLKNQVKVIIKINKDFLFYKNSKIENLIDSNGISFIKISYPTQRNDIVEPESVLFGVTLIQQDFKL
jgi:hypothetical protein